MAEPKPATKIIVATPDPPPTGIPNPIHAEDGAAGAGYQGALVAGVRTYGWAVEATLEAFGLEWLDSGWADITLRRPLFEGETVTVTVRPVKPADQSTGEPTASVAAAVGDRIVLDGTVGLGPADWLDELDPPPPGPAEDPPPSRPTYTIDDVPLDQPLRSLGAFLTPAAARTLATDDLGQTESNVPPDRIHPWFLAARMSPLTRHNFTYGPTIHFRTQIQHRGVASVNQPIVIGAKIVDAYDRKGHWYQVLDGTVAGWATGGPTELAHLRHHTIFRPRPAQP
ncbi:MAG: hypothetical protein O3C27_17215 [Actinomycetota bacterium]|nr:hypothetical protein [Actinomycetota bacterium]